MRNRLLSVIALWCLALVLAIAWLGKEQIAGAYSANAPFSVSLDWSVVTSVPTSSLYGSAIALDSAENVLVTGSVPRTSMVTAKYNRQGLLIWQRTFDNPGTREQATWIATDPFDNVWVIGNFVTTSSPYPSGFITLKYDANGNLLWQDLQPLIHGGAVRIVTDQYGNAYFTGRAWYSTSTDDIVTIKYAPDGTRLWARSESFDAFSQDGPQALALAPNGNVVVAGAAGGYFMTYVYTPNGDLVWYRNYQGSSGAHDVAVGAANEVYVVGSTYLPPVGNRELVLKYDAAGTLVWANDYPGYNASKIALDASGNLFVTGYEANFYTDWWTMKINPTGTMLWSQLYNQTASFDEYPTAIRVGSDGAAYVVGQGGPGQQYYKNVVVKYTTDGTQEWAVQTDTSLRAVGLRLGSDLSVFVIGESLMTTYHYVQTLPALAGHVTWQGRPAQPNALQQLAITLTLRLASGGPDNEYTGMTTDASGFFTVSVGSLPAGAYNWRVKDPKYLANSGSITLSGAPVTNVEMGLIRAGDADDNNVVNASDFNILRGTFGKSFGDPGYDDRSDFTGDQIVNVADFSLLKANFGQGGAAPTNP